MEILLISILFFVAWLGGHALDYVFNGFEKIFKTEDDQDLTTPTREPVSAAISLVEPAATTATSAGPVVRQARIYLVPSATRH